MHPGNNFITSMIAHRWGTIMIMISIMIVIYNAPFNIAVVVFAFVATIAQQFLVVFDDPVEKRRYTNLLMVLTMIFYLTFIPFSIISYKGSHDTYSDINATGYNHFYKDTGDNNELYFVKPGSREVSFTISMDDTDVKLYLGGIEPRLIKHVSNDRYFQYDNVDYDIILDLSDKVDTNTSEVKG